MFDWGLRGGETVTRKCVRGSATTWSATVVGKPAPDTFGRHVRTDQPSRRDRRGTERQTEAIEDVGGDVRIGDEPARDDAAREQAVEAALDMTWQAEAVDRTLARLREHGLDVVGDDVIERRRFGPARMIAARQRRGCRAGLRSKT